MANKSFDFNKVKRSYFPTTLKDGTKLQVKMPAKKTFEKLLALDISEASSKEEAVEVISALDTMCAELLSNNVAGHDVDADYMNDNYDFEEKMLFLDAYMDFVNDAKNDPN